jgi:hypothetical protein
MLNAVLNNNTGKLMEMRHLLRLRNPKYTKLWGKSYTQELRQLAQGVSGTKGTDTIVFIRYNKIPLYRRRHIIRGFGPFVPSFFLFRREICSFLDGLTVSCITKNRTGEQQTASNFLTPWKSPPLMITKSHSLSSGTC